MFNHAHIAATVAVMSMPDDQDLIVECPECGQYVEADLVN